MHRPTPLLFIALAACAADPLVEDSLDENTSEILGGTPLAPSGFGTALIRRAGAVCSGTLLTNTSVLTTRACVSAAGPGGTAEIGAAVVNIVEATPYDLPGLDFAVLRLASPLPVNGSTVGFAMNFWAKALSSIPGPAARCRGYGNTQTLAQADMSIHHTAAESVFLGLGTFGEILQAGDVGSGCTVPNPGDGQPQLIGTLGTLSGTGASTIGKYDGSGPYARSWIAQARIGHVLRLSHAINKCMDVVGVSQAEGATVQQSLCNLGMNQRWRILPTTATFTSSYTLRAAHSGKCLHVDPNNALVQRSCNVNDTRQRWQIGFDGTGLYELRNVATNMCADVPNWDTRDGIAMQVFSCTNGGNQRVSDTVYPPDGALELALPGPVAWDVPGWSTTVGTELQQHFVNGGLNQEFRFEPAPNGYTIRPKYASALCVTATAPYANGAHLYLNSCNTSGNQRFELAFVPGPSTFTYRVKTVYANKCVEGFSGSTATYKLTEWDCNATGHRDYQRWTLRF